MNFSSEDIKWTIISSGSVILASVLTRKLIQGSYKKIRGKEPPNDPSSAYVSWGEAVTWAVLSGAAIGLARVVAQRGSVASYKKIFKSTPPRKKR